MSALPPKADIASVMRNVRFVPKADMLARGRSAEGGAMPLITHRLSARWIRA
jgi:hypothetical protein